MEKILRDFEKQHFTYHEGFLHYRHNVELHFIGRFKYVGKASAMKFANFLRKNFSIEEYTTRMDAGESPLKILESKGYCSPQMARLAKRWGYAPTLENAQRALVDQTNADLEKRGEEPTLSYERHKHILARECY